MLLFAFSLDHLLISTVGRATRAYYSSPYLKELAIRLHMIIASLFVLRLGWDDAMYKIKNLVLETCMENIVLVADTLKEQMIYIALGCEQNICAVWTLIIFS
jgi:hypothetical protein